MKPNQIIDPATTVRATDNMYFTTVSALVLAVTVTLVTELILKRREGTLVVEATEVPPGDSRAVGLRLTDVAERRGLRTTGVVAFAPLVWWHWFSLPCWLWQ